MTEILQAAGVKPLFPLSRSEGGAVGDVETYIFENGWATIVALQRSHDPPADASDREEVVLTLPNWLNAYDVRAGRALGQIDRLRLELDPVEPTLVALAAQPLMPPSIVGPASAQLGGNAEFSVAADPAAALSIVRLDVIDPQGDVVAHYSGNLLVPQGGTAKLIPLAVNDSAGVWHLRARDLLSGETATTELRAWPAELSNDGAK